ncbi:DUF2252 domain-containing protein [soil metagenome]
MSAAEEETPANRSERLRRLIGARDLKMARSAHAYVRGSTAQFYAWLAESKAAASAPKGPPVWICGDCHVGNLGPIAHADGRVDVQIRDLDQTVIGDPAHDLIRLGLSLATAARGSDLPGVVTARMLEAMVDGYSRGLKGARFRDRGPEAEAPDVVKVVHRAALGRKWRDLAVERLEDVKPAIPIGRRFWTLSDRERSAVEALVAGDDVRALVLALGDRHNDATIKVEDAAYWKKGCSSLGHLRFAVLIRVDGPTKGRQYGLLDIKEAVPSVAPVAKGADMPDDPAQRVVAGARALSPNLGERMAAATLLGRPVIVRELLPQDLKIEIEQFSRGEAVKSARYLAEVVGRAHGRQMTPAQRKAWGETLGRRRRGALDAPNWLWSTVVELAGMHEAGYLEHCRRYALAAEAA